MRLLVDATALQSEHRLRGVGAYVRELIGAIEALGVTEPMYLVSTFGLEHVSWLPRDRLVRVPRGHRPAQLYWLQNEVAMRAALWQARPDAFLAPDFNGLVPNPYGVSVAVLHDLGALKKAGNGDGRGAATPSQALSAWRWRAYLRKLQRADRVIAVSGASKRDAVELLGLDERKIGVVHHGIDRDRFRPMRGEGAFAGSPPYVLHIGARNPNKNLDRLLEAFATLSSEAPDLRLRLAGPWHEADFAWLDARARALGVHGRVEHLGWVPGEDAPSLYANALAFVFPSLDEGFGLPVLEAMACGTPVITSNRSALPEVAGDAARLVDPMDTAALGRAIRTVILDPSLRSELTARGLERATSFTWARTARETLGSVRAALEESADG